MSRRRFIAVGVAVLVLALAATFWWLHGRGSSHSSADVVTIVEHGGIETITAERGGAHAEAFGLLPDSLPSGAKGSFCTTFSYPLELVFADGGHLYYGCSPERLPDSLGPVWCALLPPGNCTTGPAEG